MSRIHVVGDVLELTRSCELGDQRERCVVISVDGNYMTIVFPLRDVGRRVIDTGTDYRFARRV